MAILFVLILPAFIFYSILFHLSTPLPVGDDYDAILGFVNHLASMHGSRLEYFFAAQHNEYKLFLEHAIVWLEYGLTGHISFRLLCAVGNSFILLLAVVLWKMFLPRHAGPIKLYLFLPVPWLLFELRYAETLDWAMASLANLPVLTFSVAAIHLLPGGSRRRFAGAIVCFILAVASLGSGFLLLPIGLLILRGSYKRMTLWLAVFTVTIAAYSYQYHPNPQAAHIRFNPLYLISFLGSAGGFPQGAKHLLAVQIIAVICCFLLGCAVIASAFRFAACLLRLNASAYWSAVFIAVSACVVTLTRSELGFVQSLVPRYAIYSILLIVFAWFGVAETLVSTGDARRRILCWTLVASVAYSLAMDVAGWGFLSRRNALTLQSASAYRAMAGKEIDAGASKTLARSAVLGVYRLP